MWFLVLFFVACLAWPGLGAEHLATPLLCELEGQAQGTVYHVRYRGPEQVPLKKEIEIFFSEFDQVFSNYRSDSQISRFNQQRATEWFSVHPDLAKLVELSHKISEQSKGAFDITIGPLLKLWGFGPFKREMKQLPSDKDIAVAKKLVDYRKLLFRVEPPALKKLEPTVHVDLSGIAQGLSVDRLADLLLAKGIHNFMVEVGGEIKAMGQKLPGTAWDLAIETPSQEPGEMAVHVHVEGKGLTTAGDYRDYFEKDGKRYSHTIDPRTGRPIQHSLASVTVIAPTAAEADGWDTAFMVMGPELLRSFIISTSLSAYMISHSKQGFQAESLGAFASFMAKR